MIYYKVIKINRKEKKLIIKEQLHRLQVLIQISKKYKIKCLINWKKINKEQLVKLKPNLNHNNNNKKKRKIIKLQL